MDDLQLDSLEELLRDIEDAQRAGVFRSTPVDAEMLLRSNFGRLTGHSLVFRFRWVAAAAVLAMAFTVWTWMFSSNLSALRGQRVLTQLASSSGNPSSYLILSQCLSGPTSDLSAECRRQDCDRDGDGDVDLADIGAFQIATAVVR